MTFDLSQALQKKDQDFANVMNFVNIAKTQLQHARDSMFEELIEETSEFCKKHGIDIPIMEDGYCGKGKSRRHAESYTFYDYFRAQLFYVVVDTQIQELNNRFNNVNTKLIECLACLDPRNSFAAFNKKKVVDFAKFYPSDFNDSGDLCFLASSLNTFIYDVRSDKDFENLKGVGELAQKMVEKGRSVVYPMVYLLVKLVKLALILPVTTATVERVFSAMAYVKDKFRNRIGDNGSMLVY